jgi:hypothetical protein
LSTNRRSWPGSPNWRALERFSDLLVRRTVPDAGSGSPGDDRGEWLIAAREGIGPSGPEPARDGSCSVGHLGLGYAGAVDRITSRFPPAAGFDPSSWWKPDLLLRSEPPGVDVLVQPEDGGALAKEVLEGLSSEPRGASPLTPARWVRRTPKDRYLASVAKLLRHIQRGDIYEVNYCTERTTVLRDFDPFDAFGRLLEHTDAPFAALYRRGHQFALCMSPERFLRIEGDHVTTQPMKGTRRRGGDPVQDQALALELASDAKAAWLPAAPWWWMSFAP